MLIVIPAKPDANEALNAFALKVRDLTRNGNNLNDIEELENYPGLNSHFLDFYDPPIANLELLTNNLRECSYSVAQEKLAPALRRMAWALLRADANGQALLYQAFKYAFLKYSARHFGIALADRDYNHVTAMSNVYIFDKLTFVQERFGQLIKLLISPPTHLQQLENLLSRQSIDRALRGNWSKHIIEDAVYKF